MYSVQQLITGITNPSRIPKEINHQIQKRLPHDFGIQGSYHTGNIGDRALGEQFKSQLQQEGYQTKIFGKQVKDSNTPNRILGGGGVLHDWYGVKHLRQRLSYVSGGDRGFIIGVGAPGFQSAEARNLVTEILPQMDLITVRDEWSKENIDSICDVDVSVTACPAWLYSSPDVEPDNHTGVNFRPYFGEDDKDDRVLADYFGYDRAELKDAKQHYIENAKSICEQVRNPVFIPFHSKDEEFSRRFLDIPTLKYTGSVEETLARVSSVRQMVAMRYHSLIFAAVCRKPILALAYEPKVEAVAERLGIPSYKPHREIPIHFTAPQNTASLEESARENFNQLQDALAE